MLRNKFFELIVVICVFQSACTQKNVSDHIKVIGVETPEINLAGTWKFSMNPPASFWENEIDYSNWEDIQVPGECQMQGFAIKHDTPYVYKHSFLIPEDFIDKHISLEFHGVYSYARVWVNGQFIREHFGGFTKWNCDITSHVKPGEMCALTVEIIDRVDDISYGSGYAKHQIGGILREVVLKAQPLQHFENLYFETLLDEDYRDAELKVFYKLSQPDPSKLQVEIYNSDKKLIIEQEFPDPTQQGELSIELENPLKWDAEHPNLYTVVMTILSKNDELLKIPEKIGFREVFVDGNSLLVNGKPVKLRGACRHDIHPTLGRMTTAYYDKQDVILAKEANMNFIRTSHYPPSEAFLDYCDEYGIYVEDETAVCFVGSHRTFDYQVSGASQNLSEYSDRYLSQLNEMITHHRNHPSVIIWSIGNENVFGANFVKSYQWVKENDQTRPVIFSYPGQVPDSVRNFEILSMHYPDWKGNLNQYGVSTKGFAYDEMPVLFDEWAHVACYNNPTLRYDPNVRNFWGQSLDSMWTNVFEADGGLGGAIWCMIDETFMLPENLEGFNQWWGKLDPNIIPSTYMGPTIGYGEWGIIDTWRRKKPEFWGTKKAYSPAKILTKQIEDFKAGDELRLPVHNRFDHTNFKELKIDYKYGSKSGALQGVDIEPHEKGQLIVPKQDWKDDTKLYISFMDKDENMIDDYLIQIGSPGISIPDLQHGELSIDERNNIITVSGKDYNLAINRISGLLSNVIVQGDTIIKSGPFVNLKMPGKRVQYSTIVMDDYGTNWTCKRFDYSSENGILSIRTQGKYDSISVVFNMHLDSDGMLFTNYDITGLPKGKMIQEAGIKFIVGKSFTRFYWDRSPYFSSYPENDLGRAKGDVELTLKPTMSYRVEPNHEWEMDSKNYYYHGLEAELPYTNIVRSMKENIYSYGLSIDGSSSIEVYGNGTQACRFDNIDDENVLLVNDLWDYQSLLWGNYMKMVNSRDEIKGQVILKIN